MIPKGQHGPRRAAWLTLPLFLAAAAVCAGDPEETRRVAIAIIVHREVPVDDLSVAELRKIFLGDRQFWTTDLRITPLIPESSRPERAALLSLCEKNEAQFRHHWIAKVFRAEATTAPKMVQSPLVMGQLVQAIAGAIGFVDAAAVPRGVKVLTVNGKRVDETDYPLR